jgi:hypothetical protein
MENTKISFPSHGWIGCSRCMPESDQQLFLGSSNPPEWKIEKPNASWGAIRPLVVVLGFSRGTNQKTTLPFDEIAFAGMRPQLSKILQKLRLLEESDFVGNHINARETVFHFGSLFRCSVSMWDKEKKTYSKSGGGILEKFVKTKENQVVAKNCVNQHLGCIPDSTKLVVMLGNSGKYVDHCQALIAGEHPSIRRVNEVAYGNEETTWVHTIHAKALGDYLPQWLEGRDTAIGRKLRPAIEAVQSSGVLDHLTHMSLRPVNRQ